MALNPALFRKDALEASGGVVRYRSAFTIGAAGAVVAGSITGGRITSIARTGVGTYLVTFRDGGFVRKLNKSFDLEGTDGRWAGSSAVTLGTSVTPATLTITTYNGAGAATDFTSGDCSFECAFSRSSVK